MATPWIQVYSNLLQHPKTTNLADALGFTSPFVDQNVIAAGILVSLWTWAAQNAYNGDLSTCSDRAIAGACLWKKKPDKLVNALISTGWLDSDRKLHDWNEYAEMLSDVREDEKARSKERMRRYRERRKAREDHRQKGEERPESDADVTPESVTALRNSYVTVTSRYAPTITKTITKTKTITEDNNSGGGGGGYVVACAPAREAADVESFEEQPSELADLYRKASGKDATGADVQRMELMTRADTQEERERLTALVSYALDAAFAAGKAGDWRYIDGVLRRLEGRGIRTAADARAYDERR